MILQLAGYDWTAATTLMLKLHNTGSETLDMEHTTLYLNEQQISVRIPLIAPQSMITVVVVIPKELTVTAGQEYTLKVVANGEPTVAHTVICGRHV